MANSMTDYVAAGGYLKSRLEWLGMVLLRAAMAPLLAAAQPSVAFSEFGNQVVVASAEAQETVSPNTLTAASCVFKRVVFEHATAFTQDELRKLDSRLESPNPDGLGSGELDDLRELITRHYVDEGYINSRAAEVQCRDQVLTFSIFEGRAKVEIGDEAKKDLHVRQSYIKQRLSHDPPFNVRHLEEQFRLLLAEPLFEKINATVERADPDDRDRLAIVRIQTVVPARRYSVSLFTNNYQAAAIGGEVLGVEGTLMNLTRSGDTLSGRVQGSDKGTHRYGVEWSVPVTHRTAIFARYDNGQSSVIEEPLRALDVESKLTSWEFGLEQIALKNVLRRQQFSLGLAFNHRDNATFILGQPFSFVPGEPTGVARTDTWRFTQDYVQRWPRRLLQLHSAVHWGRSNVDPELAGASDKTYAFWQAQAQSIHEINDRIRFRLRGNVQLTNNRLMPLERFAIGGIRTVRGYRENQVVRDRGYSMSAELVYRLPYASETSSFSLVPFIDYGAGWNRGERREELASVGIGIDWQFSAKYSGLSARLDIAQRLITPSVKTSGDLQDRGIHFEFRYEPIRFKSKR
jgi:hemolysin activation/secretion protein